MTHINRDEWLKALTDAGMAGESDESAITVNEYVAMFGVPRTTAATQLEQLVRAGKAIPTQKRGLTSAGRQIYFKAYRLVP